MKTNFKIQGTLFSVAKKYAFTIALIATVAIGAAAQTNTFPSSGNAGVGTTTPTYKLQVSGNGGAAGESVLVTDSNTLTTAIDLANTSAGAKKWRLQSVGSSVSGRVGNFELVEIDSNLKAWVVQPGGNVGLGTTAPNSLLNLVGTNATLTFGTAGAAESSTFNITVADSGGLTNSGNGRSLVIKAGDSDNQAGKVGGNLFLNPGAPVSPATAYGNVLLATNSGNVGIGTTSPGFKLQATADSIGGQFAVTGSSNTNKQLRVGFNTTSDYGLIEALIDGTAFKNLALQPNGGNIGIGTASPNSLLNLVGTNAALTFGSAAAAESSTFNITVATSGSLTNSGNGRSLVIKAGDTDNQAGKVGGNLTLNPGAPTSPSTAYGNVLFATNGGNVGIGSTNPAYKLDVGGQIRSSSGGFVFPDGTVQSTAASGSGGSSQWSGTSGDPIYYTGGNVGVGTATPDNPLTVRASGSNTLGFMLKNYSLTQNLSYIGPRGSGGTAQNQGFFALVDQGTSTVAFDSAGPSYLLGGNLGIGTTTPAEKLEINGNLKLSGTGNLNATGTIEAGNIKAKYQDLAEWVPSSEQLSAGTVVVLDATKSNQVISSTVGYDTRVAGVISAQPGITLGESGEGKVLVATTGRVRVKVDASRAPIQIGDLLVTSDIPGVAMKSEPVEFAGRKMHMPGTIIGKTLEPLPKGTGEILVLLSLQ